ncbi:MAG: multiheme c-type cytochrome [Candidatus Aminicenantales bacterium]
MRRKFIVFSFFSGIILFTLLLAQTNFTYVGAAKCAMCHRTEKQGQQHPIWEKSNHAGSFNALSSPQAATYAQSAGVANPPESPQCLKCHAPLFDKAAELKAEGVTCEVCHGPGSEYRKLNIMKDRELAVKNGLILYADEAATKKQCLTCHANAHGKSFDFAASWEKIKHPVPGK